MINIGVVEICYTADLYSMHGVCVVNSTVELPHTWFYGSCKEYAISNLVDYLKACHYTGSLRIVQQV